MKYFKFLKIKSYLAVASGAFYAGYSVVFQKAVSLLDITDISFFEVLTDGINLLMVYIVYSKLTENIKRVLTLDSLIKVLLYIIGIIVVVTGLNLGYYMKINSIVLIVLGMLSAEAIRHYETVNLGGSVMKSRLIKLFNKKSKINLIIGGLIGSGLSYLSGKLGIGLDELSIATLGLGVIVEGVNLWLARKLKP